MFPLQNCMWKKNFLALGQTEMHTCMCENKEGFIKIDDALLCLLDDAFKHAINLCQLFWTNKK